jgi:flagella synthesis protein FlgN
MLNNLTAEQLITKQLAQIQTLAQLIDHEKDVLQKHDPQLLINVVEQKNNLLLTIKEIDDVISRHVEFAQEKAAGKFDIQLSEIELLLLKSKKQNQINGQIIQQSQLAVERMKTSLLESHGKSSMTYNEKGKKSSGLSSLDLKA